MIGLLLYTAEEWCFFFGKWIGVAIWIFLASLAGKIAAKKGYSKIEFFLFGLLFWPLAIIIACCLKGKSSDEK